MHDGGVESGLHALVQEHRVEHLPSRRVEPERDIGDAQHRVDVRVQALELLNGLSIVSIPSRRVSSCPVAIGNVRVSTRMSETAIP